MSKRSIPAWLAVVFVWGLVSSRVEANDWQLSPVELAMRSELASAGDDFSSDAQTAATSRSTVNDKKKSLMRAVLYSAALPGLGEYYVGHRQKARIFFATEAVTWIGYASYQIYGHLKEDDYIRFARTNANADIENKSDDFRDLVGYYPSINEYNTLGRAFDPERPYLVDNAENHWQWQSESDQATYRHLKNRSREAFRSSDFFIGIAIVSRIVSVIDAVRDVNRYNSRLDREFSESPVKLEMNPFSSTRQVVLSVRTPF